MLPPLHRRSLFANCIPSMFIGSLQLSSNLFLAPLAGYTNLPFRLCMREIGGFGFGGAGTVDARSLLEKRPKALLLAQTSPEERPAAVQLFGVVAEEIRDAAQWLEGQGVAVID